VRERRDQDEAHARGDARGLVEQARVVRAEAGQAGLAVEGAGHPVAHQQHRRPRFLELADQLAPAFVGGFVARLEQAEAEARVARRGVAVPAEVAEGDRAFGEPGGEHQLDPAVVLFALDEAVAEEGDAVALAQGEGLGGGRGGGERQQEQEQQRETEAHRGKGGGAR
jgi:hypothetical protein